VRGEEGREEERCWNLVEVAGGRIPAAAVSPVTSMQTVLETQHPRSPTLALYRQAASSSQMQRGIDCSVSSAAARPNGTGRCARGQEDRAVRVWVEPGTGEGE
jgi:hypothetical protein